MNVVAVVAEVCQKMVHTPEMTGVRGRIYITLAWHHTAPGVFNLVQDTSRKFVHVRLLPLHKPLCASWPCVLE